MNRNLKSLVGCLTMVCMCTVIATAQQPNPAQQPNQPNQRGDERAQAGRLDDRTTGASIRVSQLMGMDIQNSQGEDLGEIEDIVLDARSGRVRYAAVTYGGFLGLGDELFAVPFEAFKVRRLADDEDEYVLVLDVTAKQLEGAEGFNQENWPDFADKRFTDDLDKRYGIDRERMRRQRAEGQRLEGQRPETRE